MNALALSPLLRIVPVVGDGMDPTLRPHHDFALVRPVQSYQGEGLYLVSDALGGASFYRVDTAIGQGRLRLLLDNPAYVGGTIHPADFARRVQGIVLADIRGRVPIERWDRFR